MVQMNLFAGQEQRCRHREETLDLAGEGEGGTNSQSTIVIDTLPRVKQIASGQQGCITEGPQPSAL